jgi:hypothetical protein
MKPEEMQKVIAEKINQTRYSFINVLKYDHTFIKVYPMYLLTRAQQVNDRKNDPKLQERKKVVTGDRVQPPNQSAERRPNIQNKDNEEEEG